MYYAPSNLVSLKHYEHVDVVVDCLMLSCVQLDAVRSEYVPISILYHRLMNATDVEEQHQIHNSLLDLLQVL